MKKFELGRLFVTPRAKAAIKRAGVDMLHMLWRHRDGDWSEMDIAEQEENEYALTRDFPVFSRYTYMNVKFLLFTKSDRSDTTILLASEFNQ